MGGGGDALTALTAWLVAAVAGTGLTRRALASRIYRCPSGVTKALSGSGLPSWPMTQAIADVSDADLEIARRLWEAAYQAAAVTRRRRVADGWPPDNLAHHDDLCHALGELVTLRRLSLRELVDRDSTAVLTRSMTGYILSAKRRVTRRVLIAIIEACDVPPGAAAEWEAAWWRLAAPEIGARRNARLDGLRATQGGRLHWMGRRSW